MDEPKNLPAEHGEAVWRTICRLLGDQTGAADCFQETYIQFAKVSRRQPVREPLALLKRIATARAIDEIRRRVVERRRMKTLDEQQPSEIGEPWQIVAAQELTDNLRRALGEISADQAAVFCMTQLEGMDRSETAAVMGLRAEHVTVLLHRARTSLQGRLTKYLPPIGR